MDQPALLHANRLVGNVDGAAGLETTLSGCVLRFHDEATVAVAGAIAVVTVDGTVAAHNEALLVRAGAVLSIGAARLGVRSYLAVRGGIAVPPVLGSRSTDTLSGLGPAPLRAGDTLPVGVAPAPAGAVAVEIVQHIDRDLVLGIRFGPRDDWFIGGTRERLCGQPYTVTTRSNRVGARLDGEPLVRANGAELPSEGIVLGAVQVTADGAPLVFLADHPTTGGYPVIGVVDAVAVAALAQARPGTTVRFDGSQR
jgi:biotin-dependent carboxylase-like uncharacterized protein